MTKLGEIIQLYLVSFIHVAEYTNFVGDKFRFSLWKMLKNLSQMLLFFFFLMEFINIPQLVLIRMRFLDQIEILLFLSVLFFFSL